MTDVTTASRKLSECVRVLTSLSIRRANDSTKVCMQIAAPGGLDQRLVIFRSENDVIMQAKMS